MDVRNSKPVDEIVAAIDVLDLDPIKFKLMDAEDGQGWTRDQADRLEVDYKRFLTLVVKYPETAIAPSNDFGLGSVKSTISTPFRRAT